MTNVKSLKTVFVFVVVFIVFLATGQSVSAANTPSFSVKLRKDRKAITAYFNNLKYSTSTSYELTYTGNGIEQGVVGSIYPKEGNVSSRLLLFGTCSKKVCVYHKNIKNTRLTIRSKLKTGKTLIKRFKIKV